MAQSIYAHLMLTFSLLVVVILFFFFKVWLCLVLLATVLPLILWKHLKYLWRHYDEPTTTTAQQGRTSDINSLGLAHQYFFVLSVLVAQRIIQCAIIILRNLCFFGYLVFLSCVRITCECESLLLLYSWAEIRPFARSVASSLGRRVEFERRRPRERLRWRPHVLALST